MMSGEINSLVYGEMLNALLKGSAGVSGYAELAWVPSVFLSTV